MNDKPKNLSASIRQRLLNQSRVGQRQDFQRLLVRFAIERLLYRLSQSFLKDRFVLKGAMLFAVWAETPFRSTGDLDLLGTGTSDLEALRLAFAEICGQRVQDDGLVFDPESIRVDAMREEEEYQGARIRLNANLGSAKIPLQVDIGFGDAVHPPPKMIEYGSMFSELPLARIRAYPPETVIAEKFEAAVRFGDLSSRLKDHYDIWAVSRIFSFEMEVLVTSFKKTFRKRGIVIPASMPAAFTSDFAALPIRIAQWNAFLQRTTPTLIPPSFAEVVGEIQKFLEPVLVSLGQKESSAQGRWNVDRGWH